MSRGLTIYQRYISKLFNTDLHLFELSVWLKAFGEGLVAVFVPIILWKLGFSISEIVVFFVLQNFIDVPFNLLAEKLIQRFGARLVVILGTAAEVVYFVILYNVQHNWLTILLLALFFAILDSFYWVGHLYIFASAAHKSKVIRNDVSFLKMVRIFGALLAPLLGAYIFLHANAQTLIFFCTIILLISLLPLFKMRHLKFKPETRSIRPEDFFAGPSEKVNYLYTSLDAIVIEVETVILPFFIFFAFHSIENVALVPFLIGLVEIALAYYTGKFSTQKNIYKLISLGSFSFAMIWLLRLKLIGSEGFILISVVVAAIMLIITSVPIEVNIFKRARETDELTAVTYLNLVRMFAR